ncbi:MAG: hypothetical protein V4714_06380 [Bacteroidota bacterium]
METYSTQTMKASNYLTDEQLTKIERAVRLAESDISGEIVPVFVKKCSNYGLVQYRVGVVSALLVFMFLLVYDRLVKPLSVIDPMWYFILVLTSGLFAVVLTYIPPIGRLMAGKTLLSCLASRKAESVFLKEEVFRTRRRRGIMIFIALFERCVIIKADKGITAVVPPHVWNCLETQLVQAIDNGQLFEGIITSIASCGKLMEEYGFNISEDDTDELPNALRNHK